MFFASASAVACVNAVPVLVDIDPNTFCIDPDAVVTPGIYVAHLFQGAAYEKRIERRTVRQLQAV